MRPSGSRRQDEGEGVEVAHPPRHGQRVLAQRGSAFVVLEPEVELRRHPARHPCPQGGVLPTQAVERLFEGGDEGLVDLTRVGPRPPSAPTDGSAGEQHGVVRLARRDDRLVEPPPELAHVARVPEGVAETDEQLGACRLLARVGIEDGEGPLVPAGRFLVGEALDGLGRGAAAIVDGPRRLAERGRLAPVPGQLVDLAVGAARLEGHAHASVQS
jgi:hypothetical protein